MGITFDERSHKKLYELLKQPISKSGCDIDTYERIEIGEYTFIFSSRRHDKNVYVIKDGKIINHSGRKVFNILNDSYQLDKNTIVFKGRHLYFIKTNSWLIADSTENYIYAKKTNKPTLFQDTQWLTSKYKCALKKTFYLNKNKCGIPAKYITSIDGYKNKEYSFLILCHQVFLYKDDEFHLADLSEKEAINLIRTNEKCKNQFIGYTKLYNLSKNL